MKITTTQPKIPRRFPILVKILDPRDLEHSPRRLSVGDEDCGTPWGVIDGGTKEVYHVSFLGEGILEALRDLDPDPVTSYYADPPSGLSYTEAAACSLLRCFPEAVPWIINGIPLTERNTFYFNMKYGRLDQNGITHHLGLTVFEEIRPRVRDYITSALRGSREALTWAKRLPDERHLVRHLVTDPWGAFGWCEKFPADAALMAPYITDSHLAYKWGYQVSRDLRHLVRDYVTEPADVAAWADRHPEDRDIMWLRVQTGAGALAWVRMFPGDYLKVVPYITESCTANVWAKGFARYPEELDLVKHLVTESEPACDWGIAHPRDRHIMRPNIRKAKDAARWLEHYPGDWDFLIQLLVFSQQGIAAGKAACDWAYELWNEVEERGIMVDLMALQQDPESVGYWLSKMPEDFESLVEGRDADFLESLCLVLPPGEASRRLEGMLPPE